MNSRFLGIDMGGSSTRAHLLGDPAGVRDWKAPGGNLALNADAALGVITSLIVQARPESVCLGLAGLRTAPEAAATVRDEMARRVARVTVLSDADLALQAAFGPTDDGIVVCAGTGSVAAVRVAGRTELVGGHGFLFGDSGSAYAIGRRWIAETLRERDSGEHALEEEFVRVVGSPLDDVVARAYRDPGDRQPISSIAQHVALSDHPVAHRIIDEAACSLLGLADRARTRFGPLPVRYSGGVFAIRTIAERFETEAAATASRVRPEVAAALIAAGGHVSRP